MYAGAARLPAELAGNADRIAGSALTLLASPYATGAMLDIYSGGLGGLTQRRTPWQP